MLDEFDDILLDSYDPTSTSAHGQTDTTQVDRKRLYMDDTPEQPAASATPAKRQRAPVKKLDHSTLFQSDGIPRIKNEAQWIKFRGKGHEDDDLRRLMEYYRMWSRQLYPKLNFQDFCRRAWKACATKQCKMELNHWRDEYMFKNAPPEDLSRGVDSMSIQERASSPSDHLENEQAAESDSDDGRALDDALAALRRPQGNVQDVAAAAAAASPAGAIDYDAIWDEAHAAQHLRDTAEDRKEVIYDDDDDDNDEVLLDNAFAAIRRANTPAPPTRVASESPKPMREPETHATVAASPEKETNTQKARRSRIMLASDDDDEDNQNDDIPLFDANNLANEPTHTVDDFFAD
ncbi:replication fork protection component Swi3-domain-containing protein [Gongronella butleri]|nr:replication fork protection component Swi3-domain-containing protein [Gongronella butleri]